MMNDDGFFIRLRGYIEEVSRAQPARPAELVAIILATYGVWFVGVVTLLVIAGRATVRAIGGQ